MGGDEVMRRETNMPGVVRVTAGQRRRPIAPVARVEPRKIMAQTGYQWPERGAIQTIFQEARKFR